MRNRGELAEGWYDPATLRNAQASIDKASRVVETGSARRKSPDYEVCVQGESEGSEEDMLGPRIPQMSGEMPTKKSGPSIPSRQDLDLQRGTLMALVI